MSESENIPLLIGNLPADVTAEDIEEALEGLGYELEVSIGEDQNDGRIVAIVRFEGMTRAIAEKLAARIEGTHFRGTTLNAYVPLFWK